MTGIAQVLSPSLPVLVSKSIRENSLQAETEGMGLLKIPGGTGAITRVTRFVRWKVERKLEVLAPNAA